MYERPKFYLKKADFVFITDVYNLIKGPLLNREIKIIVANV